MPRPLFPGSMIKMPGVPDEDENKTYAQKRVEEMYPATPPLATDDRAIAAREEYEKSKLAEPTPALETNIEAYQRLSREAEEAAPTSTDVMAAGLRKGLAYSRAESPEYLAKMSETAFYKPDADRISQIRLAEAQQPDVALTAKEQAQKRLQGLAESARKRALLPGEMVQQEAKTAEAQARMEALKEASALKARANEPADSTDIQKFQTKFGKIGLTLPDNPTRGQLSQAYEAANKAMGEYTKATEVARIGATSREGIAQTKAEAAETARGAKTQEKLAELEVPGVGTALTKKDAELLKDKAAAKGRIEGGIDRISQEYSKLTVKEALSAPQTIQNIGTEAKDLIMAYKEYFKLGAPQSAELKFLYSMIGASPLEIGKTIISDTTLGTDIQSKLSRLKNIANGAWQSEVKLRTRSQEPSQAPAAQPAAAPAGQVPAPTGKRKVITDPNQL